MKSKHLIIVSLLLAVVAMGAVSASQDIATDEVLATDNITEDPIEESSVDEVIGQSNDADALELEPSDLL